ncbi:11003_t:CDS:2 [Acaulospora colombiana]|uniref:11003_t:CDS:1 n=1 Tax=Acaulospora colombiana TaxID=27376 RepID=A0ACA9KED8_9GLOM|nr:11003_t:CDS:2 [Acaulospora colombiana]
MELLPADCLREIFKVLQDDTSALYSCLFVNRLWCENVVEFLWRNWDIHKSLDDQEKSRTILEILVTCLPESSKSLLLNNNIDVSSFISRRPLLFHYVRYIQSLSFRNILLLGITLYESGNDEMPSQPDNRDEKLKHQICRNLEHISVECHEEFDNLGLAVLIECQRNLKKVELVGVYGSRFYSGFNLAQSVAKQANSVRHLLLKGETPCIPLNIISPCINIQILDLHFEHDRVINIFDDLESISFPNLRILRAGKGFPRLHILESFIEKINGCLEELVIYGERPPITEPRLEFNQILTRNCRKLRILTLWCMTLNLQYVKEILIACGDLEILSIHSSIEYEARRVFEVLKDSAPAKLSRLRLEGRWIWENSATSLVEFLESWKNIRFQPSVFYLQVSEKAAENMSTELDEIIEKYSYEMGLLHMVWEYEFSGYFD